ncbi:MAG TPA: ISNCY family transposase [Ktedonobacteraceae bacterium]
MNTQEQKRVLVLNRILAGQLSAAEAAPLLNLSPRQVQRILAAYRKEGAAAVVHGNRGRKPKHRIGDEVREQVIALAREPYEGCNQQHLRDLLAEREGIVLSRASVHRILHKAQLLPESKRRKPVHRRRRKRYAQEGMLVQIDGSRHAWLGERGPWLSLIAAIDDATGKIIAGVFREQEDAQGYFLLVRQMVQRHGRPLALYHDRHGIFRQSRKEREADSLQEQFAGAHEPTQFGRLLQELEITSIAARSPQAKGRVERLFGTLQDRLVIELRLAGASTREQADAVLQAYLPRFNAQFAVEPAQGEPAYRPLPEALNLDTIFCFKYARTVALDNTVTLGEHCLQLLPDQQRRSYARAQFEVHERLDGSLAVCYAGRCLLITTAPQEAPLLRARHGRRVSAQAVSSIQPPPASGESLPQVPQEEGEQTIASTKQRRSSVPGPDHPWRKPLLKPKQASVSSHVS